MENIKNSLFLYLTKRQKAQLLGTLKSYFKKFPNLSSNELKDRFLDDEKYYLDMENPHYEFVKDYFNDDEFHFELKRFFDFCAFEKTQLEYIKPYLDEQKEKLKQERKRAKDYKLSKLKPTQKQLQYYDRITSSRNIKKHDTKDASRLDLRNWIMEIIDNE